MKSRIGFCLASREGRQALIEDDSRAQVVNYYQPIVMRNPPDALLGQSLYDPPPKDDVCRWLDTMLAREFPSAEKLIQKMQLVVRYTDVTLETLKYPDFLESVKSTFPGVDWDKAYEEFKATGGVPVSQ